MTPPAIRVESLTREFSGVRAVNDLTFDVAAGTIFGFLGHNGAGKTTTIRLLLGLLEPTEGHAQVLGFDTRHEAAAIRERTGALLEHTGLYERLSAEDNLEFYARIWRLPREARRARIRELLLRFGLWERRHETVGTWSRGMKQKLAVARTLLHRPSLIFLDEPTAGLDPGAALALRRDLAALAADGATTIFLTTHNLAEAEALCSVVAVIRAGKLLMIGHPDEIRARAGRRTVEVIGRGFAEHILARLRGYAGVTAAATRNGRLIIDLEPGTDTAPLVRLLVCEGVEVEEVRRGSESLEEAYLALTGTS
jgi:ABC-2 type transport system ATP-binding protein